MNKHIKQLTAAALLLTPFYLSLPTLPKANAQGVNKALSDSQDKKEEEGKKEKKKIEIKPGIIASFGSGGAGGYSIQTNVNPQYLTEKDDPSPISASIALQYDKWSVKITNHSEKTVTAFFSFVQTDSLGKKIRSSAFTSSLKPKGSFSRTFPKKSASTGAYLKLLKAKVRD